MALARAAHWTPKLDGLGARLKVFGGLSSRSPRQLQQLLWSLAVLNHAPVSLLNPNRPLQLQRGAHSVFFLGEQNDNTVLTLSHHVYSRQCPAPLQ